jgi:hypothetical protein
MFGGARTEQAPVYGPRIFVFPRGSSALGTQSTDDWMDPRPDGKKLVHVPAAYEPQWHMVLARFGS